jgi:hypothetical protein
MRSPDGGVIKFVTAVTSIGTKTGSSSARSFVLKISVAEDFYRVFFREIEIGDFDVEALRFRPVRVRR